MGLQGHKHLVQNHVNKAIIAIFLRNKNQLKVFDCCQELTYQMYSSRNVICVLEIAINPLSLCFIQEMCLKEIAVLLNPNIN